jgi:2-methylcitrate dehydratase PrpD
VDSLESRLSLQHAVAMALMRGHAGVRAFTNAAVNDNEVHTCRDRVRVVSDDKLTAYDAHVMVRLRDGTTFTRESRPSMQSPIAMSSEALQRKFRELVAHGSAHCDADRLLDALRSLPQSRDVADLLRLTRPIS